MHSNSHSRYVHIVCLMNKKSPQMVGLRPLIRWTNFLAGKLYCESTEYLTVIWTKCPPIGGADKTPNHWNWPKATRGGIFGRSSNFDKCQSEVACDVISGVAADKVDMDVRSTFDESGLNTVTELLDSGQPDPFTHRFCAVFNCILQPNGGS